MLRLLLLILFLIKINIAHTQNESTISYEEFIEQVRANHPVARQASLQEAFASARRLRARGGFDPQIYSDWDEKYFDSKHYFQIFQTQVKVPLQYGLTVSGAYERNEGVFLNPERTTDDFGLWALGIEANLWQGLLFDERRAGLRQAEIYNFQTENKRVELLNSLLFNAASTFVEWQEKEGVQRVLEEGLELANTYFEATKASYENGEKPAIDTLEAALIVQDRLNALQQNQIGLEKSRQVVLQYLWEDERPARNLNGRPDSLQMNRFIFDESQNTDTIIDNYPKIREKQLKQAALQIDERLKREKTKPKIKLKYQPLLATGAENIVPTYTINDYKWGVSFSMPMFRRQARAELEENQLKQEALGLEIESEQAALRAKINFNRTQRIQLLALMDLLRSNVDNYFRLLQGEQERFQFGESSVFILNKRQEKYLEAQIKLIKLEAIYQQTILEFLFFTNGFSN